MGRAVKQEYLSRLSGNLWKEASSRRGLPVLHDQLSSVFPEPLSCSTRSQQMKASLRLCLETGSERASRGVYTQEGSFP